MQMKTSIVIPTYNNEEYTIRCMNSIGNHTDEYILLWVDDASSPESVEKVRNFLNERSLPYELIAKDENTGFAKSVNLGLARALELGSEYIVIQNNDTEVYRNWLGRMIAVAESESRIGAVGPVTSPCESWQSIDNLRGAFSQFADLPEYNNDPKAYATLISEIYKNQYLSVIGRLAFFLVLFKAEIVKKIGMLSEEYGFGFGEDDDYMLRLRRSGYFGAIAKDVFVFHNHNTTFKNRYSPQEIRDMRDRNRDLLYRKFEKGRYRPKDIDQIWDIEEAIAYAKQLKSQIEQIVQDRDSKQVQLIEKDEQLKTKNKVLTEKNGEIGKLNFYLKDQEKQIEEMKARLTKTAQGLESVRARERDTREELNTCRMTLDAVYRSTSWRITQPLRRVMKALKRG